MMDALLGFLQMLDIDTNPGGVRGVLSEKAVSQTLLTCKISIALSFPIVS